MEIGHPRAATGGLPIEQATSGASRASGRLPGIMVISRALRDTQPFSPLAVRRSDGDGLREGGGRLVRFKSRQGDLEFFVPGGRG
jgi:hypothetical protein